MEVNGKTALCWKLCEHLPDESLASAVYFTSPWIKNEVSFMQFGQSKCNKEGDIQGMLTGRGHVIDKSAANEGVTSIRPLPHRHIWFY